MHTQDDSMVYSSDNEISNYNRSYKTYLHVTLFNWKYNK